nr:GEVED domain-containing protein [uncultured Carboxylicivirga sp.]
MKRCTAVLVVLLIMSGLNAQIFTETAFLPSSLVADGDTPDDALWYETINVSGNHKHWTFSGVASVTKEAAKPGDRVKAYLISPQITLADGSNELIYVQSQTKTSAESEFEILISTTTRDVSSFTTLLSYTGTVGFNTTQSIDLSDFSGETIYLAFVRILPDIKGEDWNISSVIVDGSDVLEVNSFVISSVQDTEIGMYWNKNDNSDDVLVAFSTDGVFGDPIDGTAYDPITNNSIVGGGTILYVGDITYDEASPFSHTGLTEFTPYYYKIWSVDASNNFSYSGIELNATTTGAETILYADFEDETGDNVWTKESTSWGASQNHEWYIGSATAYRGSQSSYITTNDGGVGTTASYRAENHNPIYLYRDITIPAGSYKSVELSFFWKAGGNEGSDFGEVYFGNTSTLISNAQEFAGQATWTEKSIDITDYIDLVAGGTYTLYFMWDTKWEVSPNNPGFCIDDVRVTGRTVARPQNFSASVSGTDDVSLTWNADTAGDIVLLAYSSSGTFGDPLIGDPVKGTSYSVNDYLPGGGQVIYKGTDETFLHESVTAGVAYYKAWTVGAGNTYSVGVSTSTSMPVTLPFVEDFEEDATSFSFGSNQYHAWEQGRAVKNGGSKSAYVSVDNGLTASYSLESHDYSVDLVLPVNLKGFKSAQLDFAWMSDAKLYNEYGQVFIDANNISSQQYANQTSWTTASIPINSSYLGNVSEIKFRMYKNYQTTGANPGFCVDDISLTGSIYAPTAFAAVNGNTNANDLSWTSYSGLDEVVIVAEELTSGDVAGTLTSGTTYSEGDILSGGGTIIYIGTGSSYSHSGLKLNTRYAYKIWHKSGLIYTDDVDALVANATTPLNVGFFEDFENDGSGYKHSWLISDADGKSNQFVQENPGNVTPFSGSEVMFVSNDGGVNATYTKGGGTITFELSGETIDLSGFSSAYLSFYSYVGGSNNNGEGSVIISGNGLAETTVITNIYSDATWTKREVDISSYITNTPLTLKFQWDASGSSATQPAWSIDNIAITGAYDDDSKLTNPLDISGRATEISSLSNSVATATMLMDFDITDEGTADGKSTVVNGLTFSLDGTSTITDLTEVVSGAYLKEKDGAILGYATVYSTTLVFQQEDIITVADGTTKTYELYLYLKTTMDIDGDNETIKLNLTEDDLVAYNGSGFGGGVSESITNTTPIDVDVTKFYFAVEPSNYNPINQVLLTTPEVWAVDANNNLDIDYQGTVTLTNDLGLASSGNVDSNTSKNGVAVFPSYTYSVAGGPVVITASDGTYEGTYQPVYFSSYCTPVMASNSNYISMVYLGDINNYTGADGTSVNFYLDQSTNLTREVSYNLSVAINASAGAILKVWIDWDQNGLLEDGTFTEEYTLGTAAGGSEIMPITIAVPATASIGGTTMRVMLSSNSLLTSCDPDATDDNADGETEDYTVNITNNQWLGLTPTWDVTTNWSSGAAPTSGQDVTIAADIEGSFYPIVTSNVTLGDLDVQTGARMTINEGVQVSVDQLTNDGTMILKSRYDNLSSFISTSESGIGEVQTVMYYPSRRYWYTGHSVDGATSADYDAANTDYSYVYRYNGGWVNIGNNSTSFTDPMEGYAVIFKNSSTISHQGSIHGGDYSRSLNAGWNLVANPYPSYVDLDLERTETGVHWDFTNIQRTVYIRTTVGTERVLATYPIDAPETSTNNASQYIAPMQSFWVSASAGATIAVNATARTHSTGTLKSASVTSEQVLKVALENKYTRDELVFAFTADGSYNKVDNDAIKRFETNNRIPYLFAKKEGQDLVIGYYPEIIGSNSIQLYNSVGEDGSGETIFKALNIEQFDSNTEVLLEDVLTGEIVNLRQTSEYNFVNNASADEPRFVLYFNKVATSEDDIINGIEPDVEVINKNNLVINCHWADTKTLTVYSVDGRVVFTDKFKEDYYNSLIDVQSGIYIIELSSGINTYQEKVKIGK